MSTQRWLRIIPVAFVMYTIAFIDRTNISLALPRMSVDLQMDPPKAECCRSVLLGLFPTSDSRRISCQPMERETIRQCSATGLGACAIGCGLVRSREEFWAMRFLLGVAQGGVWPAVLVLLANWFPRVERARANSYWMLCLPISVVISSPVSGWILDRWDWRVLLLSEGLLPFAWLPVWMICIQDSPKQARWISAAERQELEDTLRRESAELELTRLSVWRTLCSAQVLVLVAINFLIATFNYGYLFWLPSAFESMAKLSSFETGALYTLPYMLAAVGMVIFSHHSTKPANGENM